MPLTHSQPDALARIYASSLFELAKSQGGPQACEDALSELEEILELASENAQFGEFFASMILSAEHREKSLKAIFAGKISDLTLKFLLVVNHKDRMNHLPAIVAAYEQMVQATYGRVEVDVYTATPIDQNELAEIKSRLQARLGKEPVLHPYTDEKMIGGLKLQIGDQLIDGSIQSQLRKMQQRLETEGGSQIRAAATKMIG